MWQRKHWIVFFALLLVAAAFRISVAHWLPNDNPDDGRVYAQMARDVLEQHVYSQDAEPPYEPTLIRMPGYPLFIAAIYSIFGHTNNGAVRTVEALIDTGTCVLVALLAFIWQPEERRKPKTALIALGFAALNPFTTIYSATILPEVPTMFFAVASFVTASIALASLDGQRRIRYWAATGILIGLAVLFRPDIGLLAAAIGLVLLVSAIGTRDLFPSPSGREAEGESFTARKPSPQPSPKGRGRKVRTAFVSASVFSLAFAIVLLPWAIRNWRTFHLFQPLSPAHVSMPDEFIPYGYNRWLKTWLDDPQYIDAMEWELDREPINVDDLPDSAFDSDEERDRVTDLFDKYNHPQGETAEKPEESAAQSSQMPQSSPTPINKDQSAATAATPKASPNTNSNTNQAEENEGNNDEDNENENNENESNEADNAHGPVELTPELDAQFGQIAAERIVRHPFRYYVLMPAKRARALWFNTHSDFWPFEGTLLPLDDLDYDIHQHIWLPLFALIVALYTIGGIVGAFALWTSRNYYARLSLLLVILIVVLRLGFLSTLENPEPRYVVEFFPFLAALCGLGVAQLFRRRTN
jgi:hypothetical protein